MRYKDLFIEFCIYDSMSKDDQIKFNKKICNLMPFLIPKNRWTGKISEDYDYTYTELDTAEIPQGWKYICFLEVLDIAEQLEKEGNLNNFVITQWKEKYFGLRLYNYGATREVNDIISVYESLASYICDTCGKPNVPTIKGFWIYARCKECFENNKYNKEQKYEDVFNLEEDYAMPKSLKYTTYSKEDKVTYELDTTECVNKINEAFKLWDEYHNRKER